MIKRNRMNIRMVMSFFIENVAAELINTIVNVIYGGFAPVFYFLKHRHIGHIEGVASSKPGLG
jgi:hypothetical protein